MATLRVAASSDISLTSSWTALKKTNGTIKFVHRPSDPPASENRTVTFEYALPSGAKITSSKITCGITSPKSGCAIRSVNGNAFRAENGSYSANVTLSGNSGTYTATFNFRANGSESEEGTHKARITFSGITLVIEYEMEEQNNEEANGTSGTSGTSSTAGLTEISKKGLSIPPQSVCVYDQEDGTILMFDGVTKISHSMTTKIEEEPTKKKEEYVNNAKNDPDKVTIDIVMSDVYGNEGAITKARSFTPLENQAYSATKSSLLPRNSGGDWPRSENAFYVLHDLKEKRKKLSVITPQFVHTDMLIASITVEQDSDHSYGWVGQIAFQHAFIVKEKKKDNNSTPKAGSDVPTAAFSTGALDDFVNNVGNFFSNLFGGGK